MKQIAEPALITADQSTRATTFASPSLFARVLNSLISTIIRKEEEDIAKWYAGSCWCDQIEHDLNYDVMTGRRTRQRP